MDSEMRALIFKGLTNGVAYTEVLAVMRERGFDSIEEMLDDALKPADAYRREWAVKSGKSEREIYVPEALR